ncbi:MAG: CHAP domain-containing protein [Marinilabiliaceae bacterium]|nr:CHAP domain-containing protein [Marinilabiliaceae bacterium]
MQTPFLPIYPAEKNTRIILTIQSQLLSLGFRNIPQTGIYDRETLAAVRAFQSVNCDTDGHPLLIDGIIGTKTWNALFGCPPNPTPCTTSVQTHDPCVSILPTHDPRVSLNSITPSSPLQRHALQYANNEVGVMELPLRSNRGPRVEQYHKSVGLRTGSPWCAAFVYWCFAQAANDICTINPLTKTGHCLTHWNKSQGHRIPRTDVLPARLPSHDVLPTRLLIKPGTIFIINHGAGQGHTGIIAEINGTTITTIEGNTNNNHSREGIGVFRHTRQLSEINTGFINYG